MKKFLFCLILVNCAYLLSLAQNTNNCNADFTYSIEGFTVKFSSVLGGLDLHNYWAFGDGNEEDGTANPSHMYNQPGTYRVLHIIKNEYQNCWDSVYKEIVIQATSCTIQAKYDWKQDSTNCLKVNFINQSAPISPNVYFSWKFGDGTGSPDINPSHLYNAPGEYEVCLVIESGDYCRKEYCQKINVVCDRPACNIEAKFDWKQDSTNCLQVKFINGSIPLDPNTYIAWKFGDGRESYDVNPWHLYNSPGEYEVCLVVASGNDCKKEYCEKINIVCDRHECTIEPKFEWKQDTVNCLRINFINGLIPGNQNVYYGWNFGDGSGSHEINPSHVYASPGEYEVCLVIESSDNCRKEYCKKITIVCDKPDCNIEPKFEWKQDMANCRKINFLNQSFSLSANVSFAWNFGDGSGSHETNPMHEYNVPGEYEVCLVVESGDNCRKEYCAKISVTCDNPGCTIEPKFDWRQDTANCLKISFLNGSIPISPNVYFAWKFGDGEGSHEISPTHVYKMPGDYEVCLVIESGNTCRKEYCSTIRVTCDEPCDVEAYFQWKRDEIKWNTIHFANLSKPVPNIWKTSWTYGDGTASNDFNSFHTYEKPGLYYVCLRVQSLNGCVREFCDSVVVRDPNHDCEGQSDFKYGESLDNNLEYRFEAEFQYSNRKYYWSFGDGTTSSEMSPAHQFPAPGIYNVCLSVLIYRTNTAEPCRSTTCKEIRVGASCDAVELKYEYELHPDKPGTISFFAVSNQTIKTQKWFISRDTTSGVPNSWYVVLDASDPTYTFKEIGWYLVCLKATFENGCEKSYCEKIYVEKTERATVSGNNDLVGYPNPAANSISFRINLETAQLVTVQILDNNGIVRLSSQYAGQAGNNVFTISIEKLNRGIYFARISFGNQYRWLKFEKG